MGAMPNIHTNGACPRSWFVVTVNQTIHTTKATKEKPAVIAAHLKQILMQPESDALNLYLWRSK